MEEGDIKSERKAKKLPSYLNDEEFLQLLKGTISLHHKLSFILAYSSGLRISEIINLKPEDIDLAGKKIFIRNSKYERDRVVPLPKGFPPSYLKLIPIKCSKRALQLAFQESIRRSKLQKSGLHFHSLRHSFAVKGMEVGLPLNQIQVLLGHSNIRTTSIYTQINPKDALDNYEKLWK